MRLHRPLEGTPKTLTISTEVEGGYAGISGAEGATHPLPPTRHETGIDLGIEAFATLADGTRLVHPGWYRQAERARKTAQRRVSRRKMGSNRRRKAAQLLAKAYQRVRRQRAEVHHKPALALARANEVISHENLQVRNMVQTSRLAKSMHDASWAAFLLILSDKAACAGRAVVAVTPAFTSQRCSGCGVVVQQGLSVRWHRRPECGPSLHRDHNAARNRERAGRSLLGEACWAKPAGRSLLGEACWAKPAGQALRGGVA
jgi:putative transposase